MAVRRQLRRIRRFAFLGGVIGVAVGARRAREQRAGGATPLGPPTAWPPLQPSSEAPVAAVGSLARDAAADDAAPPAPPDGGWVPAAADGSCPLSHPVKANDNSRIYHEPGGRFYERTRAERCYADARSAEADGYRAAKGAGGAGSGGAS